MRKILSTWGIITLMLVLMVGTVAAQTGDDPTATPTPVPTSQPAGTTFYSHPIVQILSAYFGRANRPMMPTPTPTQTPTVDPLATATPEGYTPTATPTVTPMGPEEYAAQIAMYHDEGIGFGVLVKLYAMAEDSVKVCADQETTGETGQTVDPVDPTQAPCEALTVEQLVSEFQSGVGMGQLFKEYGKPTLLGVGHVRKSLQNEQQTLQSTPTPTTSLNTVDSQTQIQKSNNGKGSSNRPSGHKPPKTRGPHK